MDSIFLNVLHLNHPYLQVFFKDIVIVFLRSIDSDQCNIEEQGGVGGLIRFLAFDMISGDISIAGD